MVKRPTVDVKEWRGGVKGVDWSLGNSQKVKGGRGEGRGRKDEAFRSEVVIKGEDDRKAWARRRRRGWVLEGGWV